MSLTNLKMKSMNPSQKGRVRGGADPSYIPGIGSQPNSGRHGSASGPSRGASGDQPLGHSDSGRMQRANTENQRSRERGETVPTNLYGKKREAPCVKAALSSHDSAPYGRSRSADSSRSYATSGAASPSKGAGRARGVNTWYPNKGIAASADSGESQRSSNEE